ncbi:cadherin repeat domain-containing protein, partial [Salmonella sp. s51228]|uniref:cadherin repeat domain-containing protein n=1 Tax=Salmonella sp. s51228 TaxID=3159652 RepID=UPI0039811675
EIYDNFTIIIIVKDLATSSLSSEITITIDITDINDNTPMFNNTDYQFTAMENSTIGTYVGIVYANESDEGNNQLIQYVFIGDVPFSVNGTTGIITVNSALDRETTPIYSSPIEASDAGLDRKTGTS